LSEERSGKSLVDPTTKKEAPIPDFVYNPVDPESWEKIEEAKANKNYSRMVSLGGDLAKELEPTNPEGAEGLFAAALGLKGLGLPIGASFLLLDLSRDWIGTQIGHGALYQLNLISQESFYDRGEVGHRLLTEKEFGPLHPDIQSFVSYHLGLYNLTSGFTKWGQRELDKVRAASYWQFQLDFLTAVGEVARSRIETAGEMFQKILDHEKAPLALKNKSRLNLARLAFERGEFNLALSLYQEVDDLPLREQGGFMLEKAWTLYYLKEYSKALGMLEALEAPYYDVSVSPERYILRMIIYKQLCHYEAVKRVYSEFQRHFRLSFRNIQLRRDLTKDYTLASMALQNQRLQYRANLISAIRREKEKLEDIDFSEFDFHQKLIEAYSYKDEQLQAQLDRELKELTRVAAEELLDAEEQVTYIDYTAQLDALRIVRTGENRNYKSEQITYMTFDKIFWPVETEFWFDELQSFLVIIKSRCDVDTQGPAVTIPKALKGEFE
jgi:hypothetical protein